MAKIRIVGDSSGYVELAAPNAAGNNTLELPSNATKLVGADVNNTITVGTGASIGSPETNVLTLGTNNSERVRITGIGSVGIGLTNPSTIFHIRQPEDFNGITISHATRIGKWRLEHSGTNSENFVFIQNNGTSDANTYVMGRDVYYWYTNNIERMSLTSSGKLGIGTNNPASHLSVRGTIESLTDTNDPNSSTEGGQLILRAPINQAGTKYRFNIDNYYGTSGGQPSAASNFRIFREDDSTTANGTILFNIDSNGRVVTPLQPRSNWQISANTTTYVRSVSIKRDTGNYVSSVPAGNGSTHGSVGRFTAPLNGTYLITIRGTGTTISGSNELLSVYGSWTSSTNVLNATNEVLDLRCTPLINDGIGWAATLYLNANDYWELDWYRPASTTYVGATVWDISTVLLG